MKMQWILSGVIALCFCAAVSADTIDTTTGLVYHLNADSGVTKDTSNVVTNWASAQGAYNFAETLSSKDPTYVASAVNGHAAIEFNGANANQLASAKSATVQTVILVTKTTSACGFGGVLGLYNTTYSDTGIRRSGYYTDPNIDYGQLWQAANENDFSYNGSMTINGKSTFTQNVGDWGIMVATAPSAVTWDATTLGDYFVMSGQGSRAWTGQIAEVAAFNGTLTAAQTNAILTELGTKYGIAVSNVPEPTSMAIVLTGGIALAAYAWRKRK